MMRKTSIGIAVFMLLILLSGCSKNESTISNEDLYGDWFTQSPYTYQSISFSEDGTFSSKNFCGTGKFSIYENEKTKEIQITLLDGNEDITRVYPKRENNEWVLTLPNQNAEIVFTKEYREPPKSDEDLTMTGSKQESDAIIASAIMTILQADTWQDKNGNTLSFTDKTFQYNNGESKSYSIKDYRSKENGFFCAFTSPETVSSMQITEIYDETSDSPDFPIGYELQVELTIGEMFIGTHHTIPEYWPT